MSDAKRRGQDPATEIERLRDRVEELEATVAAIRSGDVDALVTDDDQVFTLRTADQPYRILVETMSEGAAMTDANGLILYCNPRFAAMLGSRPEQVVGRSLTSFVPVQDRQLCLDTLLQGVKARANCETALAGASGRTVPVLFSVSRAVVDETTAFCIVAADLTTRRENERILASERLTRSILEQAAEAIVVCDGTGTIIRLNEAARSLIGSGGVGTAIASALPGFDFDRVLQGEALSSLQGVAGDRAVILNGSPLVADDGRVDGAVVTLTDITDRLRYEQDLARSNADLERFAFLASHDMQEPLRMVNAYVQLLTRRYKETGGPEIQVFAGYIETGVRRMHQLLDDLLAYSRAVHSADLVRSVVDLNVAVTEAAAELQPYLTEHGATIVADDLPSVRGDQERLVRVFVQLMENAVKFGAPKAVVLRISAEHGERMHTILVSDDGPGIAPRYRQQVLELFKRLHGKHVPGSGIGLALCKRIIEVHGGSISIEESPGGGTTVRFTVPAAGLGTAA